MTISTSLGPLQRATAAALSFNADFTRSALESSLDAVSFALEAPTFRSPNELIEASVRHADKQRRCFQTQSNAYGALVDTLGELFAFDGFGIPPTERRPAEKTAAEQDNDEALLLTLME